MNGAHDAPCTRNAEKRRWGRRGGGDRGLGRGDSMSHEHPRVSQEREASVFSVLQHRHWQSTPFVLSSRRHRKRPLCCGTHSTSTGVRQERHQHGGAVSRLRSLSASSDTDVHLAGRRCAETVHTSHATRRGVPRFQVRALHSCHPLPRRNAAVELTGVWALSPVLFFFVCLVGFIVHRCVLIRLRMESTRGTKQNRRKWGPGGSRCRRTQRRTSKEGQREVDAETVCVATREENKRRFEAETAERAAPLHETYELRETTNPGGREERRLSTHLLSFPVAFVFFARLAFRFLCCFAPRRPPLPRRAATRRRVFLALSFVFFFSRCEGRQRPPSTPGAPFSSLLRGT